MKLMTVFSILLGLSILHPAAWSQTAKTEGGTACTQCLEQDSIQHEITLGKIEATLIFSIEEKKENVLKMIKNMDRIQETIGLDSSRKPGQLAAVSQLLTLAEYAKKETTAAEKELNLDESLKTWSKTEAEVKKLYKQTKQILKNK